MWDGQDQHTNTPAPAQQRPASQRPSVPASQRARAIAPERLHAHQHTSALTHQYTNIPASQHPSAPEPKQQSPRSSALAAHQQQHSYNNAPANSSSTNKSTSTNSTCTNSTTPAHRTNTAPLRTNAPQHRGYLRDASLDTD